MKYNYDSDIEAFVREDGNGKKFYINSLEAQRIVTLRELGASVGKINSKINFSSGKVSESTIKNFLRNVDEGNIIVYGDYPAPKQSMDELSVSSLEERVSRLEAEVSSLKSECNCNVEHKISWRERLGL